MNVAFNLCSEAIVPYLKDQTLSILNKKQIKIILFVGIAIIGSLGAIFYLTSQLKFNRFHLGKQKISNKTNNLPVQQIPNHSQRVVNKDKGLEISKEEIKPIASQIKEDSPPMQKELSEIQTEPSQIKQEKVEKEIVFLFQDPSLLSFGQVREGVDNLPRPDLIGTRFILPIGTKFLEGATVIETAKLHSGAFACCFHTTESHEEINDFIFKLRRKLDLAFSLIEPREAYLESTQTLYNNLARFHRLMPGISKAKDIKIYWNKPLEEILFPHFFFNQAPKLENLLFSILPGEPLASEFQAENIDFSHQLQFVGLEKDKIISDLGQDVEMLCQEILGMSHGKLLNIESDLANHLKMYKDNHLIQDAVAFTLLFNIKSNLLALRKEKKKIDLEIMTPIQKEQFLKDLQKFPNQIKFTSLAKQ